MKHVRAMRSSRAGLLVISAAVALAGPTVLPAQPAVSAPDSSCPEPFPVTSLADGQQVTGLTVSKGTTPEAFTGSVVGVIQDGIAPGLPMIVTRLTSPEVDRVGGIWAGMSGSPVYAADGRLIGAVSYGLSWGPSPVAGVTPAEDMEKLLGTMTQPKSSVAVPRSLARQLVSSGAADREAVASGLSRLPLPLGISGMVNAKRLRQAAKRLDLDNVRVYSAGSASSSTPAIPIVAGGNLAVAASYGDISAMGVGTATAVCGDEVLGFGHPAFFTGPSTLTMHGASTLFVQEDSLGSPYKVANPGAPVGTITQDRLAGVLGVVGALPSTVRVTSDITSDEGGSRSGETDISLQQLVPDLVWMHLLANQDRVKDGIGKGSAVASWTVSGLRADGTPFQYSRTNRFADSYDQTFATAVDLAQQLWMLQQNNFEDVTFTGVAIQARLSGDYTRLTITGLQRRLHGTWVDVSPERALRVKAGTTLRLRVRMSSNHGETLTRILKLAIPLTAARRDVSLEVLGGSSQGFGEEEPTSTGSFDRLLRQIRTAPRNDDLIARLSMSTRDSMLHRTTKLRVPSVVQGFVGVPLRVTR